MDSTFMFVSSSAAQDGADSQHEHQQQGRTSSDDQFSVKSFRVPAWRTLCFSGNKVLITSTEAVRIIRDGGKCGRGRGVGKRCPFISISLHSVCVCVYVFCIITLEPLSTLCVSLYRYILNFFYS